MTAPIVTIFGGSGFVGRYIARRMAKAGWRVRVAVRRPNEANFVRPYGDVGQVEPIQANIRDDASTARAIQGATAVVNCVGILAEDSRQKFEGVQAEGAGRIAQLAAEAGPNKKPVYATAGCVLTAGLEMLVPSRVLRDDLPDVVFIFKACNSLKS